MKKLSLFFLIIILLLSCKSIDHNISSNQKPYILKKQVAKNIIYMIVDGMGFEYIKAARIYNGQKPLSFENFPCQTKVSTSSKDNEVTDSAAAATAIATSVKVNNGVISKEIPGSKEDLITILEESKLLNKSTGIISTKLFSDATPAAFASHAVDRNDTKDILNSMFAKVKPNIIFGADNKEHEIYVLKSINNYKIIHNKSDMLNILSDPKIKECKNNLCNFIYGGFGQYELIPNIYEKVVGLPLEITNKNFYEGLNIPHLSLMTKTALKILSQNKTGFFLMVESSMPDVIGHNNYNIDQAKNSPGSLKTLVFEMLEVDETAKVITDFIKENPDTLFVLTADHETGGLLIDEENTTCLNEYGCIAKSIWSAKKHSLINNISSHTSQDVPLFAVGKKSENFCKSKIDNTDIKKLTSEIHPIDH